MSDFKKPEILNQEIILDPTRVIMSKTNKDGILEFANDYFVEISGYEEYELMGKSIYCTQHPDMPEVIFKMMWEKLLKKENFHILIKNLAKNGKYYWAVSDFAFKTDDLTDEIIAIYNRRKIATKSTITFFGKLYEKLKDIERESGIALSEKYLSGHLEEIGKTFTELVKEHQLVNNIEKKPISTTFQPNLPKKETNLETTKPVEEVKKIENSEKQSKSFLKKPKIDKEIKEVKEVKEVKENTKKIVEVTKTIIPKPEIPKTEPIISKPKPEIKKEITPIIPKETPVAPKPEIKKPIITKTEPPISEPEPIKTNTSEKSFFQRLFGKTDEELEEERKRKRKNK